MSAFSCKTTDRWCLLLLIFIPLSLASKGGLVAKRDTTLDNVKAMYNRFISSSTGKAKYVTGSKNACSMDMPPSITNSPGMIPVAASKEDFQSSLGCGVCLKIHGSGKAAAPDLEGAPPVDGTLDGIVVDQDDSISQGDLALLPPQSGSGLWEITFKAVDCPTGQGPTGSIQFRFTGSNENYFKIQALNTKVPVAGIEAFERVKGKYFCLTRTPDNYFTSEGMGQVSFPLKVRLTSIRNEQLEATVNALKNDYIIPSDIQFSDSKVRGGSPEGIQCYGQGERAPSGESDDAFCVGKEDGIYADPNDETAFYMCEGEKGTKTFCPQGLKFNPIISACDVPEDVRYSENNVDSSEYLRPKLKGKARWTSLPGSKGLKVLSFTPPEGAQKSEKKISETLKPHKILSINIFHSSRPIQKGKGVDEGITATILKGSDAQARLTMAGTNTSRTATSGSMNALNSTVGLNALKSEGGKYVSIAAGDFNHLKNQSEAGSQMLSESQPKSQDRVTTEATSSSPENQPSAEAAKVFSINVYGLNPAEVSSMMSNHGEINHNKTMEPSNPQKDTAFNNQGNVSSIQTAVSDHKAFQQERQNKSLFSSKSFQDDTAAINDETSTPLKFKLKLRMDKSSPQPIFNCTLSECSQNDSETNDIKTGWEGTSQSHEVVPFPETPGNANSSLDQKGPKPTEEVHVTLSTFGSEPLHNGRKDEANVLQQEAVVKDRGHSETKYSSQNPVQPTNASMMAKTKQQENDNSKTTLSEESVQNNGDAAADEMRQQESKLGKESKTAKAQNNYGGNLTIYNGRQLEDTQVKIAGTSKVSAYNDSQTIFKEEPNKVAEFSQPQLRIVLQNPGKIRNLNSIIKSLIQRPLKSRSDGKKVLANTSSLIRKSLDGGKKANVKPTDMSSSVGVAQSILEANKEYLDDVAMQGMIYSDGDPETAENVNDIADTMRQSYRYLHAFPELPHWNYNSKQAEKRVPGHNTKTIQLDKKFQKGLQSNEDRGSSSSGKRQKNDTSSSHFFKTEKHVSSGSEEKVDPQTKDQRLVTTNSLGQQQATTELHQSYKGGILKSKIDEGLKSFCIGKESGTYASPSDQKNFLICSNGLAEERECPKSTFFNTKEKICDVPDHI
ncbi:titin homolog [Montipora capricornis]|uniref:titin homolog n=1 Tax=Montipora capricornis TaxID=246305 RepID=UPI0035F21CA5